MPDLRRLRSYVAVAEALSFRKAAQLLGLSQPPLTRHVQELEAEMGLPLLLRGSRGLAMTEPGLRLLSEARRILSEIEGLGAVVRSPEAEQPSRLCLGVVPSACHSLLPDVLRMLRARHPATRVELREMGVGEQVEALLTGGIHVGLLRPPLRHPWLEVRTLMEEPLVLAVPDDHALAAGPAPTPCRLRGEPLILYPPRAFGAGLHLQLIEFLQAADVTPESVTYVNSLRAAVGLAAAGVGLAIVPASMQVFALPGVTYRAFASTSPRTSIAAVWRKGNETPRISMFLAAAEAFAVENGPVSDAAQTDDSGPDDRAFVDGAYRV